MPDWLIQVPIQYPIGVSIGFVARYAYGESKEAHSGGLTREEANRATFVVEPPVSNIRPKQFQRKLIEAKDAKIVRLLGAFRGVSLSVVAVAGLVSWHVTELNALQKRLLGLWGLPK